MVNVIVVLDHYRTRYFTRQRRHRAPLFIAQVNPETLQVMRETERVLIAENQATLWNSGVCRISEHESWVPC
jgi:hypothetical protein